MKYNNGTTQKNKLIEKICCKDGESISETLISLLVAALALTMFAGAISASANAITKSRKALNTYYNASEEIVTMTGVAKTGGKVTISTPESNTFIQDIVYYENDEFGKTSVIAYKITP